MALLLNDRFAPITTSVGLIKAPLSETTVTFVAWLNEVLAKYDQAVEKSDVECGLSDAMQKLLPLAVGVCTRYLFLALGYGWTSFFDNGHQGTDARPTVAVLSGTLLTTGLALTVSPSTIQSAYEGRPGTYGATILEVFEGAQECRRSIACANDGGRWVFEQFGEPYAFEDVARYQSKKVADRFPPELIERYTRELVGVCPFSDAAYMNGPSQIVRGVLVEKVGRLPASLRYVSLADAREALGMA